MAKRLHRVGPDKLTKYIEAILERQRRFKWIVYWYQDEPWGGTGYAVACDANGQAYTLDLAHDSEDPPPSFLNWDEADLESFIYDREHEAGAAIGDRISELLGNARDL